MTIIDVSKMCVPFEKRLLRDKKGFFEIQLVNGKNKNHAETQVGLSRETLNLVA